jgi:hypothetical protein
MNELNPAYLAGIIDSDGSMSVARRNPNRVHPSFVAMVQLNWKSTELSKTFLDILVAEYGGSYCACKSTNKKSKITTSDYYSYCATGKAARKIASAVLPYLFLKKQQAENLLRLCDIVKMGPGRKPEVTTELQFLYDLNKSLNTKNGYSK